MSRADGKLSVSRGWWHCAWRPWWVSVVQRKQFVLSVNEGHKRLIGCRLGWISIGAHNLRRCSTVLALRLPILNEAHTAVEWQLKRAHTDSWWTYVSLSRSMLGIQTLKLFLLSLLPMPGIECTRRALLGSQCFLNFYACRGIRGWNDRGVAVAV